MKKLILICLAFFTFSLAFSTEIEFGVTFDNINRNRGLNLGLNAHISAPLQDNINLITNLESLGGKQYQADVSIENIFFDFWSINYGLFFIIQSNSIIPAIEFNTAFKPSQTYNIELGTQLELNSVDVTLPNAVIVKLRNKFFSDNMIGNFDLVYKQNIAKTVKYNQATVFLYFGTNNPTSIINLGFLADSTANISLDKNEFNIVANVGIGGTYLRNNKPFDFRLKVQVFDLKTPNKYPFLLSISTNL